MKIDGWEIVHKIVSLVIVGGLVMIVHFAVKAERENLERRARLNYETLMERQSTIEELQPLAEEELREELAKRGMTFEEAFLWAKNSNPSYKI